jgi:hypothetical protein
MALANAAEDVYYPSKANKPGNVCAALLIDEWSADD